MQPMTARHARTLPLIVLVILYGDRELVLLDQELGEIQSSHPNTLTRTL